MLQIDKLLNNEQKSNTTNFVLSKLPEWFSIEEAIIEYVNGVLKEHHNKGMFIAFKKCNNMQFSRLEIERLLL